MSDAESLTPARVPTVYFIDDSATMREVIKIAFRKENMNVIACADAASALVQFAAEPPDVVITDVIMPDKDGYEVCEFIKNHDAYGRTPVILMSGVVNRTVAERAMAVKADELIRKPFQPQDLIVRVKNLLHPKPAGSAPQPAEDEFAPAGTASRSSSPALSNLFSAPSAPVATLAAPPRPAISAAANAPRPSAPAPVTPARTAPPAAELQKLKNEIRRLELLVKKLQADLEAQHQYCAALEAHIKTLQESD
jgi:CheY-like chemotaxis protein